MKKNLIAFLLAVVMASSSVGAVPALAAETNAPETVAVEETVSDGENAAEEASVEGNTTVDETEVTNEAATDDNGSTESIQDQSTEDESETLDEEQETIEEDDAEESLDQDALSTDETEPQEAELENASENELTAEQIQAFQEKIKIWKHDNQITIVYDSTEDVRLPYHLYSISDGELLYEGNLHWNEENGLYYEAVDFDAVNEAEHRESDKIDITDISVKAVIEVITEQGDEDFDSNANSFEEVVSDDTGIVSITDVDTETDGKITAKWDCTKDEEIDGYYVIVRRSDGNDSVLVYDTDQLTDNADDDAYTQDADSQITLNIDKESVSEINVAAYRFDDDAGVKYFGKAATCDFAESKERADEEQPEEQTEDQHEAEGVNEIESEQQDTKYSEAMRGSVASGTCGDNLTWEIDGNGTLTISGTGSMYSYYDTPWKNYVVRRVDISNGVTDIGGNVFSGCTSLTSVTIPDSVTSIGFDAFEECTSLASIVIPDSVTSIGRGAFYGCIGLTNITIPEGVKTIEKNTFFNCASLTSVTIPDSVTWIDNGVFSGCTSLTSIEIPDSVGYLGDSVFNNCTSLSSAEIPDNVNAIGMYAFYGCTSLTNMTIPGSVTRILAFTFHGCTNLTSVVIPKSVTSIKNDAFSKCDNLEEVYYSGSRSDWESISIMGYNDPLINAEIIYGNAKLELEPEHSIDAGTILIINATYTSVWGKPITVSYQSDAGDALAYNNIKVMGPREVDSKYETYISLTVTGVKAGNYNLTLKASDGTTAQTVIKVNPVDISNAIVKLNCPDQFGNGCDCFPYTGKQIKPEISEVKVGANNLAKNTDYTISYGQNINYGEASVTIKGKGNYTGEKVAKFIIVPDKVKNLRYADTACGYNNNNNVGSKHRSLEMEWDAGNNVSGYIVEYSEDPGFPSSDNRKLVEDTKCIFDEDDGIQRGQVLYVRVQPFIKIDGKMYYGPYSDVMEYKICGHYLTTDFWGFKNFSKKIPESYFQKFFTPAQAHKLYEEDRCGRNGLCFGMSNLGISILHYNYPRLEDLGIDSLKKAKKNSLVRDYIYRTQAWSCGYTASSSKNNLDMLLRHVEAYTESTGEGEYLNHPVDLLVSSADRSTQHNIVVLDIIERSDSLVKIRVYDPNKPLEDMFINLTGENGNYTRWSYENDLGTFGGERNREQGGYLRVISPFDNKEIASMLAGGDQDESDPYASQHYNDWLIYVSRLYNGPGTHNADDEISFIDYYRDYCIYYFGTEPEIAGAEQPDGETGLFFWVPKTSDNTLNLEGAPAGSEIHIAGNTHAVTVTTTDECDLSICVPETGDGEVQVSTDDETEVQAVFYDYDDDGDRTKTTHSATVNAETPVTITKHAGDESDQPIASGTCGDDLTWTLDDEGTLRIAGTGSMTSYNAAILPSWNDYKQDIKSVIVKSGVTSIGSNAFNGCSNLRNLKLPEGVTYIGAQAFLQCNGLENIRIPSSVENIGSNVFNSCTSLEDITVDSANTSYYSVDGILFDKNRMSLKCCPAGKEGLYSVPDDVTLIANYAFRGCSRLTGISIPVGVSKIGGKAFENCTGLTSIVIPSSVTSIGLLATNNCSNLSVIYFIGTEEEWNSIDNQTPSLFQNVRKIFVDDPESLSYAEVTKIPNQQYTGRAIKPNFEVQHLCKVLEKGKDYTVSYFDNVNAGTATAKISGAGEYTGSVSASFTIEPKPISLLEISGISAKTYTGKAQTQAIVVEDGYFTLTKGTDYDVTYANNVKVGTASVVITGKGNYTGTVTKTFAIKKAPNTITAKNFTKTYSTKAQSFSLGVKVKNGTPTYKSSTKYVTVSKTGKVTVKAKYMGKATIKITSPANANYTATTKKITITVNPTKTALVSVTSPSAGKMTVKWKKNTVGIGYQIQYSATSKFTNPKYTTITKNSTLSKTIGSLVKGKKYYVRIRTKKIIGKSKYFSAWSAVKTVKIKK